MSLRVPSWLSHALFGISPDEALFSRRGFPNGEFRKQRHLEHIGQTFIAGYHSALNGQPADELASRLNQFEPERRGFAFEGAAMALALTDTVFRQNRFPALLSGPGSAHRYMLYVGYGWAVARLPWMRRNAARTLDRHDPVLGSLIADGYGFHEGYFHWRKTVLRAEMPHGLDARTGRLFDQGLGRSLWFSNSSDADRTIRSIDQFPQHRHADLWSGVGLAAAYAGGATGTELERMREAAGPFVKHLAQGTAFAGAARQTAGYVPAHTDAAVSAFCGRSALQVTALTDDALHHARKTCHGGDVYEAWRAEIRNQLSDRAAAASMSTGASR